MTDPEGVPIVTRKPRSRGRFSLASLLLLTAIVALVIALIVAKRTWKAEVAELQTLRDIAGHLTISDPNNVHVIGVPTVGAHHWRWRVYLPETQDYLLHLVTGKVPREGVPANREAPQVRSGFPKSGEFLLTAALEQDRDGDWVLSASVPKRDFSHPIENPVWLESGGHGVTAIEPGETRSVDPGTPLVLLRLRTTNGNGASGRTHDLH